MKTIRNVGQIVGAGVHNGQTALFVMTAEAR